MLFIQASKNSPRSKPRLADPEFVGKVFERNPMALITAQTAAGRTLVLNVLLDAVILFLARTDGTSSSVDPKLSTLLVLL